MPESKTKAAFIEPMLLLQTERLPEGSKWAYELKLDGYRGLALKTGGKASDQGTTMTSAPISCHRQALAALPDDTVHRRRSSCTGRPGGHPSTRCSILTGRAPVFYYVFDSLVLAGRDVMSEPLSVRRELLRDRVLPDGRAPSPLSRIEAGLPHLVDSVRAQGLEGLVAKRLDSPYEPGQRSGAWQKMRLNQGQEFVIAGYTPSAKNFDALVFGYYGGTDLIYVAARAMALRRHREALFRRFRELELADCPFVNLPEAKSGRWGQGLTAEKMKECRWLEPSWSGNLSTLNGRLTTICGTPDSLD